ncbi:MAG: hypothetical protein ACLFUA_12915, partial [Spirochaetales bacterium]
MYNLLSTWAHMVIASPAWNIRSWFAMMMHLKQEPQRSIAMEFYRSLNTISLIPCRIARRARTVVIRPPKLQSRNSHGCSVCAQVLGHRDIHAQAEITWVKAHSLRRLACNSADEEFLTIREFRKPVKNSGRETNSLILRIESASRVASEGEVKPVAWY